MSRSRFLRSVIDLFTPSNNASVELFVYVGVRIVFTSLFYHNLNQRLTRFEQYLKPIFAHLSKNLLNMIYSIKLRMSANAYHMIPSMLIELKASHLNRKYLRTLIC